MSHTAKATKQIRSNLPFASDTLTTVMYKHNGPLRMADCVELNEEGLWMRANELLKIGDKIELKFTIPQASVVIYLWGRVKEYRPAEHQYTSPSMYVSFLHLGKQERVHLQQYLHRTPPEAIETRQAQWQRIGTHIEIPKVGYRRERIRGYRSGDLSHLTSAPEPLTQYEAGARTEELPRFQRNTPPPAARPSPPPNSPCSRTSSMVHKTKLVSQEPAFVYRDGKDWYAEVTYNCYQDLKAAFEHNIQYGGFLLQTEYHIPKDTSLRLHLIPPRRKRGIWLNARVVWHNQDSYIGLQLQPLTPELRSLFQWMSTPYLDS